MALPATEVSGSNTAAARPPLFQAGRIPSLDGMRAVSIGLVIVSHVIYPLLRNPPAWIVPIGPMGNIGVAIFFAISGFLITSLLLAEEDRFGTFSLRQFYLRRIFRIWPAFYVIWAVYAVGTNLGYFQLQTGDLVSSALFVRNYYHGHPWDLTHAWSLSLEEQFYLIWPPILALAGRRRAVWIALAAALCSPLARVASYFVLTDARGLTSVMFHTRADALFYAALAALLYRKERFQVWIDAALRWKLHWLAPLYLFGLHGLLSARFRGAYLLPVGHTMESILVTILVLWSIRQRSSLAGRLLNAKPVVHVGVLSYSLYLWQQLFLPSPLTALDIAVRLGAIFVIAQLSYSLIEQPFLRLRKRFSALPPASPEFLPGSGQVLR